MNKKRFNGIIGETIARWQETLTSTAEPDVAGAAALLKKALGASPRIFTARSPFEFYVAQAVLRGRVSKKAAVELCRRYNVDPAFIKPLTRIGGPVPITNSVKWRGLRRQSVHDNWTCAFMRENVDEKWANDEAPSMPQEIVAQLQLQSLDNIYGRVMSQAHKEDLIDDRALQSWNSHKDWALNFHNAQSHVDNAHMCLYQAVSIKPQDILAGKFDWRAHRGDAVFTEIFSKATGTHKNAATSVHYEIFHYVPAYMQFDHAYLLLSGKPTLALNSEGNLHNETGPAVVWPDGIKLWFNDGHELAQCGELIVMRPEQLTKEAIEKIQNEEERRLAIEKMGWGKYLKEINAKVLSSRENWVDNTHEVLIQPPNQDRRMWGRRDEPLRMVLACRSTGRKYFIAVPPELPNPSASRTARRDRDDMIPVQTCEAAQKWLADGAYSPHLPYAKYPMNVVGAS